MKQRKRPLLPLMCAITILLMFGRSTYALTPQELSLFDTIAQSDAVVVGKIVHIDDRASRNPQAPLTQVRFAVSEVLHGELSDQQKMSLTFRGGRTPFGQRQTYGNVPQLAVGSEYIMFLRGDFYISPLVPTAGNIIRSVSDGSRKIAVAEGNRVIYASSRHGLVRGSRYMEYRVERATTEISPNGQPSRSTDDESSASTTIEPESEPVAENASIPATSFAQAVNVIRETAQFVQSRQANFARLPLPENLLPKELPLSDSSQAGSGGATR